MTARVSIVAAVLVATAVGGPSAQQPQEAVTSPLEEFGHNLGDDYSLVNYEQLSRYWARLSTESDRMALRSIGRTSEGRQQFMAIVTSPENHANLGRYQEISRRLALADDLTDEEARALAREGKAVVWIDGGLHATETLGAQQLGEMVYRMVSRNDPETLRILDEVIILFVHANPDGHDLVADWYMRNSDPVERSTAGLPRLYHRYIGHDNNRDFFASTQLETENINRVLYREWFPQFLYNHHQSGPAGTVLWSPPFRDPFNYNQDPLLVLGLQTLGLAIHSRLASEGKPGATMRSGGPYDGWWNGGIRNTAAFHNTIAILTEMIGNPTPMQIPLRMNRQLPTSDLTYPIDPQPWHFRQSIEYSVTCNLAVLDLAARTRENILYNRYVMGRNSIERGSRDTWTPRPHRYAAAEAAVAAAGGAVPAGRGGGRGGRGAANEAELWAALHRPEDRDPRGYIIPADQPDFPTATRFVNALLETGITVHYATEDFAVGGRTYPGGSYVVLTAQAFRPHVIDMFEPQDHPDNFAYPGAPPTTPYDSAGWTLAYQMGIEFDRMLDPFTGAFEPIDAWNIAPPPGQVVVDYVVEAGGTGGSYFLMDPVQLDSFRAANRLLEDGAEVLRDDRGRFVIPAAPSTFDALRDLSGALGIDVTSPAVPRGDSDAVQRRPRIGLWDRYGGSMDAGWARWILEQFEFPFERVYAARLDAGDLNAAFDTLIFVDGGIPGSGGGRGGRGGGPPADVPVEYRDQIGSVTADRTVPQLRRFIENGGTVIAIGGSAANLADHLDLPVTAHLVENGQPLPRTRFYVPSSVLRARVDTTHPVAAGLAEHIDIFFDNSPVWRVAPDAAGVTPIAWFDTASPLRSGWAWGQEHLEDGVVALEARIGQGRALLFGAEILQRAQPYGTFKFLFNGIYTR